MACFHPLQAWQRETGEVVFAETGRILRELSLPCGRCIGCRLVRSRSWSIRCMHESQMHDSSVFVTLTYDDLKHEYNPSLEYRDFQLFMKRLRRRKGAVRFFACGEYGEDKSRPHFHALLFGIDFVDKEKCGADLYRSNELDALWSHGNCQFGSVTFQSAAYVASYSLKKRTGDAAREYYERVHLSTGEIVSVEPEFGRMSLRPAIGMPWFLKYFGDVYAARDGVVVDGKVLPAPRFYDQKLRQIVDASTMGVFPRNDRELEIEQLRYANSLAFAADCTPERLAVREHVAISRQSIKRRVL